MANREKQTIWSKFTLFLLSAGVGLFLGANGLVFASVALLILVIFEREFKINVPTTMAVVFVLFILASLYLGSYHDFYERFLWWDDVLHAFYGGAFAIIGFIIILLFSERRGITNDPFIVCTFSLCFSIACGAMWEVYEYTYDILFDGNMQRTDQGNGVSDTMHDIILESASAFIVNFFIYVHLSSGTDNWVGKIWQQFIALNKRTG